jgi:predicted AAA+ superfamily ATPase
MQKEKILEILNDWNLWKKKLNTGIERAEYINKALSYLKSNMIIALTGVRRSGKSFILRQIASNLAVNGFGTENILIVNLEDRRFEEPTIQLLDEIYETFLEYLSPNRKPIIMLDEINRVNNWEKWVRTFHELQKGKIIVTGSTSELLNGELATLLTGRHLDMEVFPLNFNEFLKFNKIDITDALDVINKRSDIQKLLKDYIEYGGFPEVVLSNNKKEILLAYFDDIVRKDVVERHSVRKISKLLTLAKFYLANISSHITFSSLERYVVISSDTIEKFSLYLQEVGLIFFLKRFSYSVKEQDKSSKIIYTKDIGLANVIGFKFSENYGKMMENIVAIELMRRSSENRNIEIFYWKDYSGKEIDFIIKDGLKIKEIIQVCYNIENIKTKDRETKILIKAMKEFKLNKALIITDTFEGKEVVNDGFIEYVPLWKWLLIDNSLHKYNEMNKQ